MLPLPTNLTMVRKGLLSSFLRGCLGGGDQPQQNDDEPLGQFCSKWVRLEKKMEQTWWVMWGAGGDSKWEGVVSKV